MKLFEVYHIEPKYAWFEPAPGPMNTIGVRLAFIEPIEPKFNSQIEDAKNTGNKKREEMIALKKQNYLKQGANMITPDLGWWASKEDFDQGEPSFRGFTKGNVFQKHPDLEIFGSKEEAVKAAKAAGIL